VEATKESNYGVDDYDGGGAQSKHGGNHSCKNGCCNYKFITIKVAGAAVAAALNLVNLLIDAETEAKPQNLLKQHIYLNYGA
jgi:hypothetical protein